MSKIYKCRKCRSTTMLAQPQIYYMGATVDENLEIISCYDDKDFGSYYRCDGCDSDGTHPSSFAELVEVYSK
ncbi:MAG: hypothetical protein ACRCXT_17995 [Paraclostridium sp.]